MHFVKTMVIASLLVTICSIPANAWGKKEQGFLLGTAAALTLPHLIKHRHYEPVYGKYYHHAPNTHHSPIIINIEQSTPQIVYVKDDNIPMHRKAKTHNYINNKQVDRITIEQKVTIVNR